MTHSCVFFCNQNLIYFGVRLKMTTTTTVEQACEESTLTLSVSIDLVNQVFRKVVSSDTSKALDESIFAGNMLNQAIASQLRRCLGVF